jgi:hypothetical protein
MNGALRLRLQPLPKFLLQNLICPEFEKKFTTTSRMLRLTGL